MCQTTLATKMQSLGGCAATTISLARLVGVFAEPPRREFSAKSCDRSAGDRGPGHEGQDGRGVAWHQSLRLSGSGQPAEGWKATRPSMRSSRTRSSSSRLDTRWFVKGERKAPGGEDGSDVASLKAEIDRLTRTNAALKPRTVSWRPRSKRQRARALLPRSQAPRRRQLIQHGGRHGSPREADQGSGRGVQRHKCRWQDQVAGR